MVLFLHRWWLIVWPTHEVETLGTGLFAAEPRHKIRQACGSCVAVMTLAVDNLPIHSITDIG